jgi:HTH-type transcriptional regulator / antitoxin HigA
MITNDRQYKITKSQILRFQESLADMMKIPSDASNFHPKVVEASKTAMESQLHDLLAQVEEYEALKAGKIFITEVKDLKELPELLIKARIANGLTQSQLARQLEMKEQQVQRYESELYSSASLKTILKIAELLQIKINGDAQLKEYESVETREYLNPKNYPFKEMFKRNWFEGFSGTLNEAIQQGEVLLLKLFDKAGISSNQLFSLNKKKVRRGGQLNSLALDAWHARVIGKARKQTVNDFNRATLTESWLRELVVLSKENKGPFLAAEYLMKSGIKFVIEPQIEGTYLDGAAILLEGKYPLVAMTLRYDRLDNFWFVLFHEIAHIKLHLNENLEAVFDDLDIKGDDFEDEADKFSLNVLLPNDVWKKSLVRFSPTKDAIVNQAQKLNIHPALVAGRIRRETGKYYQLNDLVGQGEVRKHFLELNH